MVLDKLYDIPSKIIHVNKNESLESILEALKSHFVQYGSPVMMGGDVDCSSKGIMGIHVNGSDSSLLVVVSKQQSMTIIISIQSLNKHDKIIIIRFMHFLLNLQLQNIINI